MSPRPTLVIGNKNYSSWSLRGWLALAAFDVPFDEVFIPLDTPEFERDIKRHSPSGRVPALRHGDVVVWDSLAIAEYVNETFLDGKGWPTDPVERAVARSISAEMHSGFSALRGSLPMNSRKRYENFVVPKAAARDIARVAEIWRDCRARFGRGGDFLFGAFTLADAMYAPVVLRFESYGVALGHVERAYVDAMLAFVPIARWRADSAVEPFSLPHTDNLL